MARLLLIVALIQLLPHFTLSAGKCNLSSPPTSWLVTTGTGISKWATAGVAADGDSFCVTGIAATVVEVDYHVDLGNNDSQRMVQGFVRRSKHLWENPENYCVMDDPRIHVCLPFCSEESQPMVIEAALSSGYPQVVADSIDKTFNQSDWAITVLQVDFNNPSAFVNASIFADPNVWCSVYIGVDPTLGFPYLFEIQLVKVLRPSSVSY